LSDLQLGTTISVGPKNEDVVQYDVPKNPHKRSQCDINFEVSCAVIKSHCLSPFTNSKIQNYRASI